MTNPKRKIEDLKYIIRNLHDFIDNHIADDDNDYDRLVKVLYILDKVRYDMEKREDE